MNSKLILTTTILFCLIFMGVSQAFIVYLRPAKMIIRANLTAGETLIERQLIVKNKNNITISIQPQVTGEIQGLITLENGNLTLNPNTTNTINFTVTPKEPGMYKGKIEVIFSSESFPGVSVPSEITVIATGNLPQENPFTSRVSGISLTTIGIVFGGLIVVGLFGVVIRKRFQ